jgi:hypothetical protein
MDDEALLRARLGDVFPAVDRVISRDIALKLGRTDGSTRHHEGQGGEDLDGYEMGHRGTS